MRGQRMNPPPPVTARLTSKGDHIAGTLTNNTRFILSNPSVEFDGRYVRLPLIQPGETLKVDYEGSKNLEESLLQLSLGRVLFTATIKDFSPGVQIGAQASGGTITLLENIK